MGIIKTISLLIRAFLVPRLSPAAENLALRQQVAVYQHTVKRPKLRPRDRIFWVWLSRLWSNWRSVLAIVQPETVIRRECLNQVVVLNEVHLQRILKAYFEYYHEARAHLSLERNSPVPREVEPASRGKVISIPQVGGLHHRYARAA